MEFRVFFIFYCASLLSSVCNVAAEDRLEGQCRNVKDYIVVNIKKCATQIRTI
jgi:hypothetical protein